MERLTIISRTSALARIQARLVGENIVEKFPKIDLHYVTKTTNGDVDLETPLSSMANIGVFTNDIRSELISGNADLAVHSWKDLPTEMDPLTEISGTIERADLRDVLLYKKKSIGKKIVSVSSSSPRRQRNLTSFLKKVLPFNTDEISFSPIRGNIFTRIKKFLESDSDALIIAKAALDRLQLEQARDIFQNHTLIESLLNSVNWMILPLSQNPSAAGQGALAIECLHSNTKVCELVRSISNQTVFQTVNAERAVLSSYGGGCHQKIGISITNFEHGSVTDLKGLTAENKVLDNRYFKPSSGKQRVNHLVGDKKSLFDKQYFSKFFDRVPITGAIGRINLLKNRGLYISRDTAVPVGADIAPSNTLWVSGIVSWQKLAARGIWVNGTSDGLGEHHCKPEHLFKDIKWIKLSHDKSHTQSMGFLATYTLKPLFFDLDLRQFTHFYWMSGSAFLRALELYPSIVNMEHSCGMGSTFDCINNIVPDKVTIYLTYEDWYREFSS